MPPSRAALLAPPASVICSDAQKRRIQRVLAGLALAATVLVHAPVRAQGTFASLDLQVIDAESKAPLAGATVHLDGVPRAVSDGTGRVFLRGLEPGRHQLEVVMLGRRPDDSEIEIGGGWILSLQVELAPQPVALPGVVVTRERGGRAEGRGARRRSRWHVERAEIASSGARRLSELLIRKGALQPNRHIRSCAPSIVIDRQRMVDFDMDAIPIHDVETVDVYPIGFVPSEYGGIVAGNCGIVVVRTRHK